MGNFKSNMLVPMKWAGQDRKFADSVKENLDVITGNRGDPLDRAITARDLIESGLAKLPAGSLTFGGNSSELIPPSQIPDLLTPPAPTNLQASGAFQNILLSWDLPLYTGHAHVGIGRNATDNIATAALLATTTQAVGAYADNVGEGSSFYYWVRAINKNDIAGPFNASAGTLGQTAPDIQFMLTLLSSQITSSQLATSLATPIASISGLNGSIGTLNGQVSALNATVAALNSTSAWAAGNSYSINDQVTYNGNLFSAKTNHTSSTSPNNAPPTTTASNTDWLFVGAYTSLSAAVGANTSGITQLNTVSASSTSAAAQAIAALNATVNDSSTGVSATATALDAVTTTVNHGTNGVSASASKIGALETTVNNASTGVSATAAAVSAITTEVFPNGAASSSRLDTLEVDVNNLSTGGNASAVTALTTEVFPNGSAAASRIDGLEATVNDANNGVSATASALNTVKTLVNHTETGVSATAVSVDGLQTTVGDHTTSISTQASSINGLSAQYSVKIDTNGHVAGFGLSSTLVNGTPSSAFVIRSDKFAVVNPSDTSAMTNTPSVDNVPFIVTAATTIDGVAVPAGAYMKAAFIHDGAITNAKIRNATIDDAKIADLRAEKINTGTLDASLVTIAGVAPSLNIRSADAGARMQITAATVQIFDANGIRVKLGQL